MSEAGAPKVSVKKRLAALASKAVRASWTGVFLGLSLIQYVAYYDGLLLWGVLNRWWVAMVLCVTYMFRLDFFAAAIGFIGAWKAWHFPIWVAAIISGVFGAMSFVMNYGPGKKWFNPFEQLIYGKKSNPDKK
jgi:hypothetical protein